MDLLESSGISIRDCGKSISNKASTYFAGVLS